jgi:hypothetical protein
LNRKGTVNILLTSSFGPMLLELLVVLVDLSSGKSGFDTPTFLTCQTASSSELCKLANYIPVLILTDEAIQFKAVSSCIIDCRESLIDKLSVQWHGRYNVTGMTNKRTNKSNDTQNPIIKRKIIHKIF